MDFQPFRMIEDKGFQNFVKQINPNYVLPSRKTVSATYIPALYEKCLQNTKEVARSIQNMCITTDCWTSRNNESYMAITGHFIDKEFSQHNILLDCSVLTERHTSVNLAAELHRVTEEWNVSNKILIAISDNAANIRSAIIDHLNWPYFGCFAHTLNLIVTAALREENVQPVIIKIKTIVSHFKRSSSAQNKLNTYQINNGATTPKKLIQDVVTRWNSTYYMIDRLLELEDAVKATIALLDTHLETLNAEEWSLLKELRKILNPFESATKAVSGEKYMSGSLVIVLTNGLKDVCKKLSKVKNVSRTSKNVLKILQTEINTRLGKVEESDVLAACTFLDPRFKNLPFQDQQASDRVKKTITALVSEQIAEKSADTVHLQVNLTPTTSDENALSVWETFDAVAAAHQPQGTVSSKADAEVQRYLDDDLLPRHMDPLKWWLEHAVLYPNLSNIVQQKYCALGTSVPCERLFSKAGIFLNERRSSLSSNKVKQLVSLHANSKYK